MLVAQARTVLLLVVDLRHTALLAQHAVAFGGALVRDPPLLVAFALEALGTLAFCTDPRFLLVAAQAPVMVAAVAAIGDTTLFAFALVLQSLCLVTDGRRSLATCLVALRLVATLPVGLFATLALRLVALQLPGALGLVARGGFTLSGALVALAILVVALRIAALLFADGLLRRALAGRLARRLLCAPGLLADGGLAFLLARSLFALSFLALRLLALPVLLRGLCPLGAIGIALARLIACTLGTGVAALLRTWLAIVAIAAGAILCQRMRCRRQHEAGGNHHREKS